MKLWIQARDGVPGEEDEMGSQISNFKHLWVIDYD
jgi:hypothetical protein